MSYFYRLTKKRETAMINGKRLVALCTSRVYDPQIHGFIEKFSDYLKERNCCVFIFAINSDIYWEEDRQAAERYVFHLIPYDFVDAVVIMDEKIKSHKIANKIIRHASEKNVPVIIADGRYENTSCINFDYEKGFEKVVRHVIEYHKVKRPHMMCGHPDNEFSERRIEVFKKVIEENGFVFSDSMLSYGYFWADPCRLATEELLEREELPDAIICANDVMAITVAEMFKEAGYKIPEDVIITGFDGYDEIYFTSPKITTASCDIILLAQSTAETVINTINGSKPTNSYITPIFISNQSCGCPEHTEHPQILLNWFNESFSRINDDNRVLQQLSSSMQTSSSPGELVSHMECYKTDNLICVVDRNIFNSENNYFTVAEKYMRPKDFVIMFDSDHPKDYKADTFTMPEPNEESTEDVLSVNIREKITELSCTGYPLIFNSLDFMDRPFGFICYYFNGYFISNYTNTMSVTNSLCTGIGGYVNIQYQRTLLDRMDEMYKHDILTGLYNRAGFLKVYTDLMSKGKYFGEKVTVIMSDMDGLKYTNDTFGHAEGDNAIYTVAQALASITPENGISARFGGDELFSVIFGEFDSEKAIKQVEEYLSSYNSRSNKPYKISTSCGYSTSIFNKDYDFIQAMKDADEMMYEVKNKKMVNRK